MRVVEIIIEGVDLLDKVRKCEAIINGHLLDL